MSTSELQPPLNQVALSVLDPRRSEAWYCDGLGFLPAGGSSLLMSGPIAKLMPADVRPCDIGYTRFGVHVADFDATLDRLARMGTTPLASAIGERGRRRVCVCNPDGISVEIMEDDPLPQPAGTGRTGTRCEVEWTIRCRSRVPLLGGLLRRMLQRVLDRMLEHGLKRYAEVGVGA